ncbi:MULTISPECIES: response regulator transcription factor [unclassified Synechocystis]|uniref:response regulator transcription factor n=1 Tax=unclassified Synechocystis TaxID=2640012 RepID=UPI00040F2718|nr:MULTISPECIES: response regulator transcription factor [unclassified Synechocystis]AIE74532.1 regulatory protein [Synechocystis sp. PCC 6714]MCT0254100.1 response regulator transcription factor [Synechocystis sp. CS-94]
MPNILIVEDDQEIAQLIRETLEREQFSCTVAHDGQMGLEIFQVQAPDLIVLDLMLPKLDGLELCIRIRQQPGNKDPYILMLTAKGEEIDRIIGLSTGADDYLVKPFSPRELVARVRALLRRQLRQGQTVGQIYRTPHFQVDLNQHQASFYHGDSQEELELTGLEFNLLATFMSYPGRVWNRAQLIEKLWGNDFFGDERVVDTHIRRLRKKIEPDPANPSFIKTVIGLGYKFEDPG